MPVFFWFDHQGRNCQIFSLLFWSKRWHQEDILKLSDLYILYFVGKGSEEAIQMLKKAEAANEESPFGELTQRLVAGLLEENTINQADVEESTKKGKNKQRNKNKKQSS